MRATIAIRIPTAHTRHPCSACIATHRRSRAPSQTKQTLVVMMMSAQMHAHSSTPIQPTQTFVHQRYMMQASSHMPRLGVAADRIATAASVQCSSRFCHSRCTLEAKCSTSKHVHIHICIGLSGKTSIVHVQSIVSYNLSLPCCVDARLHKRVSQADLARRLAHGHAVACDWTRQAEVGNRVLRRRCR